MFIDFVDDTPLVLSQEEHDAAPEDKALLEEHRRIDVSARLAALQKPGTGLKQSTDGVAEKGKIMVKGMAESRRANNNNRTKSAVGSDGINGGHSSRAPKELTKPKNPDEDGQPADVAAVDMLDTITSETTARADRTEAGVYKAL